MACRTCSSPISPIRNTRLYKNDGDGSFTYATDTSGVAGETMLHSGWGVRFFDDDNDGLKDLIIAQGPRYRQHPAELSAASLSRASLCFCRIPAMATFVDISQQAGDVFKQAWVGRGLAVGDLDNDGREDVVVTTNDGPAYVLHNETSTANHWLTLDLVGHQSNRDAIGAEVKVTNGRRIPVAHDFPGGQLSLLQRQARSFRARCGHGGDRANPLAKRSGPGAQEC